MTTIGKNMVDLRVSNRVAILNLLYTAGGLSRREIAAQLNLTPAAISHITGEMIQEGVLIEAKKVKDGRMGRHAVILEINVTRFRVLCAYIPTRDLRLSCFDLAGNVHFSKELSFDESHSGKEIIGAVCGEMQAYIDQLDSEERKWIIGIGLGIKGICDVRRGISVKSFGLWEDNLPLRDMVEARLGIRTLVDNDIRCMAYGDMLFNRHEDIQSMLFVKLGPLVGAAFVVDGRLFTGHSCHAMELGHFVVDPLGSMCRCGKRGCLETIIGFDVIANHLALLFSPARVPILYRLTGGDKTKLSMETIMESFDQNERVVVEILDGALERFAFALVNAIGLIDPQRVTLYGIPFESPRFVALLHEKLKALARGDVSAELMISNHNLQLADLGCASIVIKDFLANGALPCEKIPCKEPAFAAGWDTRAAAPSPRQ